MLGATLQCSLFVTRHAGVLRAANAAHAAYLFQPDKLHNDHDIGDKTIQCGRKADGFKLWLLWKALGDEGLAQRVDHAFSLAAYLAAKLCESQQSDGAWVLAFPPSCTNVTFWYVPSSLRPLPDAADLSTTHPIHSVAPRIKAAMQAAGDAMIGFQSVKGRPNFFRWVVASADSVSRRHIDAVLMRIAALGEQLTFQPLAHTQ